MNNRVPDIVSGASIGLGIAVWNVANIIDS
jgi:hypothetical protein